MPRKMPRPSCGLLFDTSPPAFHTPHTHLAQPASHMDRIDDQGLHRAPVQYFHIEHDAVEGVVLVVFRLDGVAVMHEVISLFLEEEGGHFAAGEATDAGGFVGPGDGSGELRELEPRVQGSQKLLRIFQQLRPIEQDRRSC